MVEPPSRAKRSRGASTQAIHGPAGNPARGSSGTSLSPPIVKSSVFSFGTPYEMLDVFEDRRPGFVYSRYGNPTMEQAARSLQNKPAVLYFETPTNPLLRLVEGPGTVRLVEGIDAALREPGGRQG